LRTFSEVTDQDDLGQVIELWGRCESQRVPGNLLDYIYAARNPPSASILIGKKAGNIVCGAMVGYTGQRGWINDICVDQHYQRQGFGKAIVAAAETWLAERGAPNIRRKVPYTNLAVIGFYDKLGYRFQDAVVLGKVVPAAAHDCAKRESL
jgi:ribosomal protein S18 acetylase RimI-like enzyme